MNETKQLLQWLNEKAQRLRAKGDYEGFECYRRYYLHLQSVRWNLLRARRRREAQ